MTSAPRPTTDVDRLADTFVDRSVALNPALATYIGVDGAHDALPDLSPDGLQAASDLRRDTLRQLDAAVPADRQDRITVAALRYDLQTEEAIRDLGDDLCDLDILESPQESLRLVFDMMPTASDGDWATIARRMAALPAALDGYAASLRLAAARGQTPARRQVEEAATRIASNIGPEGFFAGLADRGPEAVAPDLRHGARLASGAYAGLQDFLRRELLPLARERDPFGRERYAVHLRRHLGADVDLDETYAWGQEELARLTRDQAEVAARISPGRTVKEVMAELDADPGRQLHGVDTLRGWMQERSDRAVEALGGSHFDIPEPLRQLECLIAPTQSGGVYYTGPSDDFSRPGRMWWSVPAGLETFSTWQELTTIYHEGVPGHHLQIGTAVYARATLNRWRRLMSGCSGHAEGWALYAERLMAELGYLDDPADRLGMLDAQAMRAARVLIDIGVHCELPMPANSARPGEAWTFGNAMEFFAAHSAWDLGNRTFEILRYFGWPGQAPTYKLGERLWLQLRADARADAGERFDLTRFHQDTLELGGLPLDVLREAVLDRV
ncbi:DUF885 domain-containing protein [Jatrophihabitans sp. YIM 134969]